jgi:hypothetical protein
MHLVRKRNCLDSGRQDLVGIVEGFFPLHHFRRPN